MARFVFEIPDQSEGLRALDRVLRCDCPELTCTHDRYTAGMAGYHDPTVDKFFMVVEGGKTWLRFVANRLPATQADNDALESYLSTF